MILRMIFILFLTLFFKDLDDQIDERSYQKYAHDKHCAQRYPVWSADPLDEHIAFITEIDFRIFTVKQEGDKLTYQ